MTEAKSSAVSENTGVRALFICNLHVHVKDCVTDNDLAGAAVDPDPRYGNGNDPAQSLTGPNGVASFVLNITGSEKYDITVSLNGYYPEYPKIHVGSGGERHEYVCLEPIPPPPAP